MYYKCSYDASTKDLCVAFEALAMNLFNLDLQLWLANLHNQKKLSDKYTTKGAQFKAHFHWLEVGDQALKELFQSLRAHHTSVAVKKIKEYQQIFSDLSNILQAFVCHYEKVFTA